MEDKMETLLKGLKELREDLTKNLKEIISRQDRATRGGLPRCTTMELIKMKNKESLLTEVIERLNHLIKGADPEGTKSFFLSSTKTREIRENIALHFNKGTFEFHITLNDEIIYPLTHKDNNSFKLGYGGYFYAGSARQIAIKTLKKILAMKPNSNCKQIDLVNLLKAARTWVNENRAKK